MARDRVTAAERWLGPLLRDASLATRRLFRAPVFVAVTALTLTLGLGLFAVVYTVVEKILLEPMPYRDPGDLYYVWRDYGEALNRRRAPLPGTDVLELQKAGGERHGPAPQLFDGRDSRCSFILAPPIIDRDVGARFRERERDRPADAA